MVLLTSEINISKYSYTKKSIACLKLYDVYFKHYQGKKGKTS